MVESTFSSGFFASEVSGVVTIRSGLLRPTIEARAEESVVQANGQQVSRIRCSIPRSVVLIKWRNSGKLPFNDI